MIRIEFWNGQLNKKGKLVSTTHNPCLWSNVGIEANPWRDSYTEALKVLDRWFKHEINDTDLLHNLRYVAYGLGKRSYDDTTVVWWGNMTVNHKPKIVVENDGLKYTIYFTCEENSSKKDENDQRYVWKADLKYDDVEFHWKL